MHYFKHYPFTWFIFAIVMILSFMPVPETPLSDVAFIDKWTHIVMYFGQAGAIWLDHLRLHGLRFRPFLMACVSANFVRADCASEHFISLRF